MSHFSFGIKTLYSPNDPIKDEIMYEVASAKQEILMMIYGFHLPDLTDLLIAKHKAGVLVQCVLDFSQSKGKSEMEEVKKLNDAGMDVVIGKSPIGGQIMHEKGLCIDGVKTITGSFNFSLSASKQVNHMDFIHSTARAQKFSEFFHEIRNDMLMKGKK